MGRGRSFDCVDWRLREHHQLKVTSIKEQVKNPNRVSVFVDDKYSFSLTLDQLLEQKLKKNVEIDEPRLVELKKLSDEGKLKAKALDWLMVRPHSKKEFREYAYRKKIEKDLSESWLQEFEAKKYLDDQKFAQWFAENRMRKNKSGRAIMAELASKGVSREIIQEVIVEQSNDEESLGKLIIKLKRRTRYQDEKKLIAYLLSKGFRYEDVKSALNPSVD